MVPRMRQLQDLLPSSLDSKGISFRSPFLPFFLLLDSCLGSDAAAFVVGRGLVSPSPTSGSHLPGPALVLAPFLRRPVRLPGAFSLAPGVPVPVPTACTPMFWPGCTPVKLFGQILRPSAGALVTVSSCRLGSPTLLDGPTFGCFLKLPVTLDTSFTSSRLASSALLSASASGVGSGWARSAPATVSWRQVRGPLRDTG